MAKTGSSVTAKLRALAGVAFALTLAVPILTGCASAAELEALTGVTTKAPSAASDPTAGPDGADPGGLNPDGTDPEFSERGPDTDEPTPPRGPVDPNSASCFVGEFELDMDAYAETGSAQGVDADISGSVRLVVRGDDTYQLRYEHFQVKLIFGSEAQRMEIHGTDAGKWSMNRSAEASFVQTKSESVWLEDGKRLSAAESGPGFLEGNWVTCRSEGLELHSSSETDSLPWNRL